MNTQKGFTSIELIVILVWVAGFVGWIWNIVKIIDSGFDVITGLFVARCIGVFFAPLGAVLGFV